MRNCTKEAYEGDLVSRLKNWRGLHLAHNGDLFEEAAAEIARLRLTDAERECLEEAIYRVAEHDNEPDGWKSYAADTLRGLLERTKGGEQ